MGYLSVAIFFFFSGYGLVFSYQRKGDAYIDSFLKARIIPLYCVNIVLILVYTAESIILRNDIKWTVILKSFLFGETIIINGWFLQVSLLIYLAFYLVYQRYHSWKTQTIAMSLFTVCYSIVCLLCSLSATWFESIFAFLIGMLWCVNKVQIDAIIEKHRAVSIGFSFICFSAATLLSLVGTKIMRLPFKMLSAVLFVILVMTIVYMLVEFKEGIIDNAATRFLGKISLELYVSQGLFLKLFHNDPLYISNMHFYIVLVAVCTFIFAVAIHPLFTFINSTFALEKPI